MRPEAAPEDVVEREVLQRVGARRWPRWTAGLLALLVGISSGVISCSTISASTALVSLGELAGLGHPADQVLDQRLGHPGVDVVVRHLVADAVGAPAQRELGEVAGAEHDAAAMVGEAEEVVGAQPRLDVLEGHVVDRLRRRRRGGRGRRAAAAPPAVMSSSSKVTPSEVASRVA